MGAAVGTQVALGIAEESTYGTPVAPTSTWFEILNESARFTPTFLASQGLRRGTRNLRRGSRRVVSARGAEGTINLEVSQAGFGLLWKHLLGVETADTPAVGDTTWAMGSLQGLSLTVQKILADEALTNVETYTYHGGKITGATLSLSVDQILQAQFNLDFEDEDRAGDSGTAAGTPTYGTSELYTFLGATLNVGGSPLANALSFSVTVENNLNTSRFYLGSNGLKAEPTPNDFPAVSGQIVAEFDDPADLYAAFEANTALAFSAVFADTSSNQLTVSVPEIRLTGDTPQVSGPETVQVTVPFEGFYDGTNPGVSIVDEPA